MTVDELRRRKREHEDMIRHLTGLLPDQRTVVLRMLGNVRGKPIELHQDTAAATVIRSGTVPSLPAFLRAAGCRDRPPDAAREAAGTSASYAAACAAIDEVLGHKLAQGVPRNHVSHLSVFAFARLPLLVFLGAGPDDAVQTRSTSVIASARPDNGQRTDGCHLPAERPACTAARREGVLVLSLSGTVRAWSAARLGYRVPDLADNAAAITPHPDILTRRADLDAFELAVRASSPNRSDGEVDGSPSRVPGTADRRSRDAREGP